MARLRTRADGTTYMEPRNWTRRVVLTRCFAQGTFTLRDIRAWMKRQKGYDGKLPMAKTLHQWLRDDDFVQTDELDPLHAEKIWQKTTQAPILRPQAIVRELKQRYINGMDFDVLVPDGEAAVREVFNHARWNATLPTSCGICGKPGVVERKGKLERRRYACLDGCRREFGVKTNTFMQRSLITPRQWLHYAYLVYVADKQGKRVRYGERSKLQETLGLPIGPHLLNLVWRWERAWNDLPVEDKITRPGAKIGDKRAVRYEHWGMHARPRTRIDAPHKWKQRKARVHAYLSSNIEADKDNP